MKVAFTTTGETLDAPMDSRFGRASRFLIFDTVTEAVKVVENSQNMNAPQGAGIQAAQTVAGSGVGCVVTGHCGPKAFSVLTAAGIKVYNSDAPLVAEALRRFKSGSLTEASSADVDGHWT